MTARFAPLLLSLVSLLVASRAEPSDSPVRIRIDTPRSGAAVENRVHLAPIRGSASAEGHGPAHFDVMLAIDVSQSTRIASGVDVDGDGVVGVNPQMELVAPGTYPEDL